MRKGEPNFDPSRDVPTEEAVEVSQETRDLIVQGRGLEAIQRVGWEKYRNALGTMHYSEIVDAQVGQIDALKKKVSRFQQPVSEQEVLRQNTQSLKRAEELSQNWKRHMSKEKHHPHYYAEQEGNKKLWIYGRAPHSLETGRNGQKLMRRIYCAVPTTSMPEAFTSLFFALEKIGAMRDVDIAMNLESYHEGSMQKTFENNSIILYCYGDDPVVMEKAAKALTEAKQAQPAAWHLSEQDRIGNKKRTLKDFMIPLDDTAAFVEADNTKSYHSGPWGDIYQDITGEISGRPMDLPVFADKVRFWNTMPKAPIKGGYLIGNRRKNMPGLIARE